MNDLEQAIRYIQKNKTFSLFKKEEKEIIMKQLLFNLEREFKTILMQGDKVYFLNVEKFIDETIADIYERQYN